MCLIYAREVNKMKLKNIIKQNKFLFVWILGILLIGSILFFSLDKEEVSISEKNEINYIEKVDLYYNIDNNSIFYEKIDNKFIEVEIE